jgi:dihydrodipicolinate synthase/N-acetylneuraminate lyase
LRIGTAGHIKISTSVQIGRVYPVLHAFFGQGGELLRAAYLRQVEAAISAGANGVAVLGLGTEVAKPGRGERPVRC